MIIDEAEALRQARAYATGVFSRTDDPPLRAIVVQAAEAAGSPMACLTLFERDQEVVIVSHGFKPVDLPRAERDAASRASHPWMVGPPHAAFLIDAPLSLPDGQRLGTLYLLDTAPRALWSDGEAEALRASARLLLGEILSDRAREDFAPAAIGPIVELIREAARDDREGLVTALDRILRSVEKNAAWQRG